MARRQPAAADRGRGRRSRGLGWLVTDTGAAYHHGYTGTSLYLCPALGRYAVLLTNAVYHGFSGSR
ncbi:hypothetical protein ACFQ1I_14930 [Kitasatospora arboriphila]